MLSRPLESKQLDQIFFREYKRQGWIKKIMEQFFSRNQEHEKIKNVYKCIKTAFIRKVSKVYDQNAEKGKQRAISVLLDLLQGKKNYESSRNRIMDYCQSQLPERLQSVKEFFTYLNIKQLLFGLFTVHIYYAVSKNNACQNKEQRLMGGNNRRQYQQFHRKILLKVKRQEKQVIAGSLNKKQQQALILIYVHQQKADTQQKSRQEELSQEQAEIKDFSLSSQNLITPSLNIFSPLPSYTTNSFLNFQSSNMQDQDIEVRFNQVEDQFQ